MLSKSAALSKDKRNVDAVVLQHRHFALIAGIIAKIDASIRVPVAKHFADELADTNPNFNRQRFLDACFNQ